MPNEPRRQVQDLFLTCAQPQYNSPQELVPRGIPISPPMTTTTFSAATVTSALVGCFAMPADGDRDYPRMIKSVAGTVATVDKAWNSTVGVSLIRIWLPPDVPARSTATGSTTALTSSPHASITNEPTGYWNSTTKGYFLLGYTGANAGGAYRINTFTSGTGVFDVTGTSFTGAPADGDLFLIRKLLRPEAPPEIVVNPKTVTRRVVGFKDADAAVPVTIEASVAFTLPQRPISTAGTAPAFPTAPLEIGDLLQDFMTETLSAGMTSSSATGNTVSVSSATAPIGSFILCHTGEAAQLLSVASTTYTFGTGQITAASLNAISTAMQGSAWYQMKTSDFRNRLFDCYRGRIHRHHISGCFPSLEIEITRDQVVKFNFKYTGDAAFEYPAADPNTISTKKIPFVDQTVPFDGKAARFLLNGVRVLCGDMKINLGISPVPRPCLQGVNQMDGMAVQLDPVTFSTTILADQDDVSGFEALTDRLRGGDVIQMLYQKGSAATQTFCIGMPAAQMTKCQFVYNNGQGEYQIEGVCQLPAISGLGDTVPAFALGWL